MYEALEEKLPFYLRDLHAPVPDEVESFDLPVEGVIPPEIDGLFLRNGPNPLKGDPGHWFLGDGMLHGVSLAEGRPRFYRNRFVKTRALEGSARHVDNEGNVDFTAGVANTHVVHHAGRTLALVENGFPWEVDGDLETVGYHDFDGRLKGPMTAHPKFCPKTGEMHFFGYHFAPPFITYHRVDARGELVFSREIEIPRPVMMHDFAITEQFVVFMDLPVCFSPEAAARGGLPYQFIESAGARLGFLRRDNPEGEIIWVDIDPCYVFHPANAFDEGDHVTLDVARYDDLFKETSGAFEVARMHRFEIDLANRKASERPLDDLGVEFPRIKESLNSLPYRYTYAVWSQEDTGGEGRGIVRYDLGSGKREIWDGGGRFVPSEAVFAPAAKGSEDEGWLLSYVYDRERAKSDLAILDATRVEAGPIAQIELPSRVPIGFHGSWIPAGS